MLYAYLFVCLFVDQSQGQPCSRFPPDSALKVALVEPCVMLGMELRLVTWKANALMVLLTFQQFLKLLFSMQRHWILYFGSGTRQPAENWHQASLMSL